MQSLPEKWASWGLDDSFPGGPAHFPRVLTLARGRAQG